MKLLVALTESAYETICAVSGVFSSYTEFQICHQEKTARSHGYSLMQAEAVAKYLKANGGSVSFRSLSDMESCQTSVRQMKKLADRPLDLLYGRRAGNFLLAASMSGLAIRKFLYIRSEYQDVVSQAEDLASPMQNPLSIQQIVRLSGWEAKPLEWGSRCPFLKRDETCKHLNTKICPRSQGRWTPVSLWKGIEGKESLNAEFEWVSSPTQTWGKTSIPLFLAVKGCILHGCTCIKADPGGTGKNLELATRLRQLAGELGRPGSDMGEF